MAGVIGPASEFYRLRLTHIDEGGEVEFDWPDDVLWHHHTPELPEESDVWILQTVTLDAAETVVPVASFAARDDAVAALEEATSDLQAMTKSEFEAEYLHEAVEDTNESHDESGDASS